MSKELILRAHALLIGVGSYAHHPDINVPITARDAQAIRPVLLDPARCGYKAENVHLLHDQTATRAGILSALEQLAEQMDAESSVLIFYAGHGDYATDGNYTLTAHDTRVVDKKIVPGSGVAEAELLAALRLIPAKRLLLFFNACHSGTLSPSLDLAGTEQPFGSLGLPTPTAEAILSSGEGRILISACRPEQLSYFPQEEGKLTYFTQALVDGLSGKGYVVPRQGYISAFGLYEHIYLTVKEVVQAKGQLQEPELTVLKGVGPFPVALYRGATSLGIFDAGEPLPPDTAARQVEPARSQRFFQKIIQNVTASGDGSVAIGGSADGAIINTGGGTAVQGDYNTVVGAGGVSVGGNVGGDLVTGTKVTQKAGDNAIQVGKARDVMIGRRK